MIQLNPKEEYFVNDQGEIVTSRVKEQLNTTKYLRQDIQLIVCDYDLADDKVNGFDMVSLLRNELKSNKNNSLFLKY